MINKTFITVNSKWQHEIQNLLLTHSPKSNSLVVLFPGGEGTCDIPLLHYARKATLLTGCDVLSLEYGYFKTIDTFKPEFFNDITNEVKQAIHICLATSYDNLYFISKSLGTSVAGEISKSIGYNKVHNLYLTPTMNTIPHIINSKCTIVVGTKDKYFSEENIKTLKGYPFVDLHIVNDASHSLEIDNDYRKSIEILKLVSDLCVSFVKMKMEIKCILL